MVVLKFGGTSVADAGAIQRVARIVARETRRRVVVVSALSGVTDRLIDLAEQALAGGRDAVASTLAGLRTRHLEVAMDVARGARLKPLIEDIDACLTRVERAALTLSQSGRRDAALLDFIAVQGELLSSRIVSDALQAADIHAVWVNGCDLIATDAQYTRASPDIERTRANTKRLLQPLLARRAIPVVGGFIGSAPDGSATTLGRGGSDYSASILGACLGATEIQIWTDVNGILTADPRLVPTAQPVPHVSYDEAYDLACFGAKVLHPGTVAPAVQRGIPLRVLNSMHPDLPGTRIDESRTNGRVLTAMACKDSLVGLELRLRQHIRSDSLLAAVLEVTERRRVSVVQISAADGTLSLAVHRGAALDVLVDELSAFGDVAVSPDLALVCVVGEALRAGGLVATQVREELRNIGAVAVAQPTPRALAALVPRSHFRSVANRLHERFFNVGQAARKPHRTARGIAPRPPEDRAQAADFGREL